MSFAGEPYLTPYLRAAERYGGGFSSLLWASPKTQRARFDAIRDMYDPTGKSMLDVGCGRADLLGYLIERDAAPSDYVGIEAVRELADSAEAKAYPNSTILRADFVREPARMFVAADLVVFSGSLNTLDDTAFYPAIQRAYDAAAEALVFNFLCSPLLAGREYLVWRHVEVVQRFAQEFCPIVRAKRDYLEGDCTILLLKSGPDGTTEALHG